MVIESFVLTEVIIQEKRGSEDPQWTVWKLSYYLELPLRRVFLATICMGQVEQLGSGAGASSQLLGTGASTTTGSTTGSGAGAGAAGAGAAFLPPNKSPNLDIVLIELLLGIYQATSSTNSPRIFLFIFLDLRLLAKALLI
jgi:hypothetical protein